MNTSSCPDENLLAKFLEGNAEPELKATVEAHLDRCASCTDLLAALALAYRDRRSHSEAVETHVTPPAKDTPIPGAGSSLRPELEVLLLALTAIHAATVAWIAPMWLRGWMASPAPVEVTPVAYLALLMLCISAVAMAFIVLASLGRWWRKSTSPLLALVVLSCPNPAALVLFGFGAVTLRKTIAGAEKRQLEIWLIGVSIPVFLAAFAATATLHLLPVRPGLDALFAAPALCILAAGLLSAVGAVIAYWREPGIARYFGAAFGAIALASGVGTAFGLSVLSLLGSRRAEGGPLRHPFL